MAAYTLDANNYVELAQEHNAHIRDDAKHVTAAEKTAWNGKANAASITASTSTKITYNAQGIITAGAYLAATDIPNLDAAKITSGTLGSERGGTGMNKTTFGAAVYAAAQVSETTPSFFVVERSGTEAHGYCAVQNAKTVLGVTNIENAAPGFLYAHGSGVTSLSNGGTGIMGGKGLLVRNETNKNLIALRFLSPKNVTIPANKAVLFLHLAFLQGVAGTTKAYLQWTASDTTTFRQWFEISISTATGANNTFSQYVNNERTLSNGDLVFFDTDNLPNGNYIIAWEIGLRRAVL